MKKKKKEESHERMNKEGATSMKEGPFTHLNNIAPENLSSFTCHNLERAAAKYYSSRIDAILVESS